MLKKLIRFLKTSPFMIPALALIDLILFLVDTLAILTVNSVKEAEFAGSDSARCDGRLSDVSKLSPPTKRISSL